MSSRAQISGEFFIFIGLAFLIAIAFEFASLDQINTFRLGKENDVVKDVAIKFQKELITAASVEDGYVRFFTVPSTIDNVDYRVITQNSTITILSNNSIYIVAIPSVVGQVSKGTNKINKTGGVIYLNVY